MTIQVLHSRTEIDLARRELRRQGLSQTSSQPMRWLRRIAKKLGFPVGVNVGDTIKSWDVWSTAQFVQKNVPPDTPILDIGAYASEILCVLHRLHYAALTGVDLNPALKQMPYGEAICYEVADFLHTPFPDEAFGAITAISVIEHGFQSEPLLREVTRLLRPGGYFIASFDYWPEKVDTTGIDIFGMDWRIFSRAEVLAFLDEAQAHALRPCGAVNLAAGTPTMLWSGKRYTFAWLALQKHR